MKKVVLSLAVLFAAAMVSCSGNKENKEEGAVDTTAIEMTDTNVMEAPADSNATAAPADSNATAAPADSNATATPAK